MRRDLIILDKDKLWAQARIAELDEAIQALGPEFHDVFNQSSETWHDNAPFDALRDRQSVLDAERQQPRGVLRDSLPAVPPQKKGVVGIGSTVELSNGAAYFIAGDWTPYAGQTVEYTTTISYRTPIAEVLLGKKSGATVGLGRKTLTIQSVK